MKRKVLIVTSGSAIVCPENAEGAYADFPPNEPLNLYKVQDIISGRYSAARMSMKKAVRPNANSLWTQDKLESDFESFVRAITSHLNSGHNNLHEVYNCLNQMRNRIDLETRTKHPIPECLTFKLYLDVVCEKFMQENKGIDLLASMVFVDGHAFRKNPLLKEDREIRLEQQLAEQALD